MSGFWPVSIAFHFGLKRLNLELQRLVLTHFALQEPAGKRCLFSDSARSQYIHIAEFVLGIGEVLHLHQALLHQRLQAVVQPPHADTQLLGQFALSQVWVLLQDAHNPEIRVFLQPSLTARHVADEFRLEGAVVNGVFAMLPPCRIKFSTLGHAGLQKIHTRFACSRSV